MAISSKGSNIEIDGWALVNAITQPSGDYIAEYRGDASKLDEFLEEVNADNSFHYDTINIAKDPTSGVATVTITANADVAVKIPEGQTRMPTCNIQGTMLSPKLHQCPSLNQTTNSQGATAEAPLPLEAIQSVEWNLKNKGVVTSGDFPVTIATENVYLYARWRMFGLDTYLAPSYAMTITIYLDISKKTKIGDYIKTAGKVWAWASAINVLPETIQPQTIDVAAWLAQAPSIAYTKEGITITQVFIGAEKFPSFYESENADLVYNPPAMPEGYWRDSAWGQAQITSGDES